MSRIPETRDVFLPRFLFGPSWPVPLMPATQESGWTAARGFGTHKRGKECCLGAQLFLLCSHPVTTQASLPLTSLPSGNLLEYWPEQ